MKDRYLGCFTIFIGMVLAVSLLLNLVFVAALAGKGKTSSTSDDTKFEEHLVQGKKSEDDKIAIVDLAGVITSAESGQIGDTMVDDIILKLKQAREEDKVKAVILRVDSPGGEVKASDDIYNAVAKTRAVKPVVVYMDSVAASGGYYSAMGGSYIVASDLTITASIGVIMQTINYKDLLPKIGLKTVTFKSGKLKDLLNPARDITPEEQALVQGLIDETYGKFVGIVAKERKLDVNALRNGIADGRILSGRQALDAKLVDQLGTLEDAIKKAEELAKVTDAKVVRYQAPVTFAKLFRLLGESGKAGLRIQVGPDSMKMETDGFIICRGICLLGSRRDT